MRGTVRRQIVSYNRGFILIEALAGIMVLLAITAACASVHIHILQAKKRMCAQLSGIAVIQSHIEHLYLNYLSQDIYQDTQNLNTEHINTNHLTIEHSNTGHIKDAHVYTQSVLLPEPKIMVLKGQALVSPHIKTKFPNASFVSISHINTASAGTASAGTALSDSGLALPDGHMQDMPGLVGSLLALVPAESLLPVRPEEA